MVFFLWDDTWGLSSNCRKDKQSPVRGTMPDVQWGCFYLIYPPHLAIGLTHAHHTYPLSLSLSVSVTIKEASRRLKGLIPTRRPGRVTLETVRPAATTGDRREKQVLINCGPGNDVYQAAGDRRRSDKLSHTQPDYQHNIARGFYTISISEPGWAWSFLARGFWGEFSHSGQIPYYEFYTI